MGTHHHGFLTDYDYAARLVYVDNATFLSMSKAKDILDERQCTVHNYKSQLQYFN